MNRTTMHRRPSRSRSATVFLCHGPDLGHAGDTALWTTRLPQVTLLDSPRKAGVGQQVTTLLSRHGPGKLVTDIFGGPLHTCRDSAKMSSLRGACCRLGRSDACFAVRGSRHLPRG
jgi:hypothetical protein